MEIREDKSTFMEIKGRPNPNKAFPNPNLPRLCFIKNVVKNPRIIIGDYTYMTIYNPSEETIELLASLATSEGLFIWSPEQ